MILDVRLSVTLCPFYKHNIYVVLHPSLFYILFLSVRPFQDTVTDDPAAESLESRGAVYGLHGKALELVLPSYETKW